MSLSKKLIENIFMKLNKKKISDSAKIKMIKLIEKYSYKIAKQAIKNADYMGRKIVIKEDIKIQE